MIMIVYQFYLLRKTRVYISWDWLMLSLELQTSCRKHSSHSTEVQWRDEIVVPAFVLAIHTTSACSCRAVISRVGADCVEQMCHLSVLVKKDVGALSCRYRHTASSLNSHLRGVGASRRSMPHGPIYTENVTRHCGVAACAWSSLLAVLCVVHVVDDVPMSTSCILP